VNPAQFLEECQQFYSKNLENRAFYCEMRIYSSAGKILDILQGRLRSGIQLDRDQFVSHLGTLLFHLGELSHCHFEVYSFVNVNWDRYKSVVPGGYTGCALSILNLLKSQDLTSKIQSLSVACSHLGVTWEQVTDACLKDLHERIE